MPRLRQVGLAHEHVQIAGRPAVVARLPLASDAQARAVVDAGGTLHRDLLLLAHAAGAAARRARILDHLPGAAALRAGPLDGEEALGVAHLSAAGAAAAGHRLRARLGAAAVARGALHHARHVQGDVLAEDRLLELDGQVEADVVAARGARAAAAARGAEEIAEAEEVAEDVAEVGELIRVEAAEGAARRRARRTPRPPP